MADNFDCVGGLASASRLWARTAGPVAGMNMPAKQTSFGELLEGVQAIAAVEERLFRLMDRLVGPDLCSEARGIEDTEPGLLGQIGEQGRVLARSASAMNRYLSAIERALP